MPSGDVKGTVRSAELIHGSPDGLWAHRIEFEDGAEITWNSEHGEEACYVLSGALDVAGQTCRSGGAIVIERLAQPVLRALGPTTAIYLGSESVPFQKQGDMVHIVGPRGTFASHAAHHDIVFFAEATCAGCELMLFTTARNTDHVQEPHSHSQSEILFLLQGSISMGSYQFGPGDTIAISADRRYGFRSGPEGFAFLNFRPALSWMTERDGTIRPEGGEANAFGLVGDSFDVRIPDAPRPPTSMEIPS
jgi:hypothetical protein